MGIDTFFLACLGGAFIFVMLVMGVATLPCAVYSLLATLLRLWESLREKRRQEELDFLNGRIPDLIKELRAMSQVSTINHGDGDCVVWSKFELERYHRRREAYARWLLAKFEKKRQKLLGRIKTEPAKEG